ncbi:MAG TPA: hypothetical protein PLL30_02565 [Candidatus Krumholzibacteria bacterium]|nr:hypothetical protein [Candidatus Krumholzibacteria bacterium]HPD70652.1 hypothetical protein [Candidatus Krumholzibacteria bacterium]HRY39648.1 hypothetical protein [Candidatus Krumholzibacteria bacterium]
MGRRPRHAFVVESCLSGLRSRALPMSLDDRVELVERLLHAGLCDVEVGGCRPGATARELLAHLPRRPDIRLPVVVTDPAELAETLAADIDGLTVTVPSTESAARHEFGCSTEDSLRRLEPVALLAERRGVRLRGILSGAVACPHEGPVEPRACAELCSELRNLGCFEVSLADTTGAGDPASVRRLWDACAGRIGPDRLAARFWDTRGLALANLGTLLPLGLQTIDAALGSVRGGIGPIATEDVVALLDSLDIETWIDRELLAETAWWLGAHTGRGPAGARRWDHRRSAMTRRPSRQFTRHVSVDYPRGT